MAKPKKIIGYHFTGDKLRDGQPIPPIGEWLMHTGPVIICESGLHYSLDPFDALQYAPGAICHMVEIEEVVTTQSDKGVCRRRKILKSFDATQILRYFARMQALSVIHLYPNGTDDVVFDYLITGNKAQEAAALAAARAAVWDAAGDAAGAAAWDAVRAAAWAAARAAAQLEFNSLINAEFAAIN